MGTTGYPRRCNRGCGVMIWMQKGNDGFGERETFQTTLCLATGKGMTVGGWYDVDFRFRGLP